jgi:protein kinase-like protein
MLARRPAHPIMASIGFGGSVAASMWLLPLDGPVGLDPLLLPAVAAGSSITAGLLVYTGGWRVVAASSSTLVLACLAVIHLRIQQGSWSGPPLALGSLLLLAMASWVPRRRPGQSLRSIHPQAPTQTQLLPTPHSHQRLGPARPTWSPPSPGSPGNSRDRWPRPREVTCQLNGRWAVLGAQPLPGADPSGHSQVHLALDTWQPGRQVVAKFPGGPDVRQSHARLIREARLLLALRHNPHLVRLLEAGHDRATGSFYLILTHYPQGSLAGLLAVTPGFALGWVIHMARELVRGLVSLQRQPEGAIAHRDLNPRNVLLRDRQTPLLCDLGMARRIPADPTDHPVTTGQVYSPWYSAPELVHGRTPWGLAVDSYGIGAILYELLTGYPPLRRESLLLSQDFLALTSAGIHPTSAGTLNPTLPAPLVDLIDQCLAPDPADRPPTAQALLRRINHLGTPDLPIPYAVLCHWNGPTRRRSA